jgi:predicted HTH transcriptional regulator
VPHRYLKDAGKARSNLPALLELIFSNPFVTVARLQERTGLTAQGARNVIKDAVARGWLEEIGAMGRGGGMYWVAQELFGIVDAPWNYM